MFLILCRYVIYKRKKYYKMGLEIVMSMVSFSIVQSVYDFYKYVIYYNGVVIVLYFYLVVSINLEIGEVFN